MAKSLEEIKADLARKRQPAPGRQQPAVTTTSDNGAPQAQRPRHEPERRRASPSARVPRGTSTTPDIHRTLPHSVEAEQGVLGSMLSSPREAIPIARRMVTADTFYIPAHATIFNSLVDMFENEGAVDLITFTQHLRDPGQLEAVGGAAFVTSLFTFVPTAANIGYYIEIVRDKYLLRELVRIGTETARRAFEEQDDVAGLVVETGKAIELARLSASGQLDDVENFGFSDLLKFDPKTDPDNLVGFRWLCRGFTCLWAAAAGAGKSALGMQLAIFWGLGQPVFGIKPVRPLKSLIIQAENDLGDTGEQLQGVLEGITKAEGGLELDSPQRQTMIEKNVIIRRVIASTGMKFCSLLETLVEQERPDFVWIDPLFAFAGCDLKDAQQAGEFVREGIIPIAVRHRVCLHVIHHVGKPDRDSKAKSGWTDLDFQYLGFGSSEIQNAFRAVNVMIPVAGHEKKFRLILSKRGSRAGAKDTDGEFTTNIYLSHAPQGEGICWMQIEKPEDQQQQRKSGQFIKEFKPEDVLAEMSAVNGIKTGALQKHCADETGMSRATFYRLFDGLKSAGKITLDEDGWTIKSKQEHRE